MARHTCGLSLLCSPGTAAMALLLMGAVLCPAALHAQAPDEDLDLDLDTIVFTIDEVAGKRRARTIRALCKMDDPRVAEALVQVIANPKPGDKADIQDLAYRALYRLRSPAIVPELKKMLDSGTESRVVYAIQLLGRTLGAKSFDLIEPHMRSQGETLLAAIKAIGETRSPRAVEILRATLRRVGTRSDPAVFVRMSLIRLGDKTQLKPLIEHYQRIMNQAFGLKVALHYVDNPLKKKRMYRRVRYLWSLQAELRAYFTDLEPEMLPALVQAVETTNANAPKQIVLDMLPKMMDRERAPKFAAMLRSRYIALRIALVEEYLRLGDAALREQAVASIRKYLTAPDWADRRYAIMHASLLPEAERMPALSRAAEDPVVWVRAEAVRQLGRVGTQPAHALIRRVRDRTKHDELRFICRCALAGLREDLHGVR